MAFCKVWNGMVWNQRKRIFSRYFSNIVATLTFITVYACMLKLLSELQNTPICWLGSFVIFQGIWVSIAKKHYIVLIFQRGGGVQTPCLPSGSVHVFPLHNCLEGQLYRKFCHSSWFNLKRVWGFRQIMLVELRVAH